MNAVCVIAHPDDCVIFAYSLISKFPDLKWNMLYLTYRSDHARAQEISGFWSKKQIPCEFLGFTDDYRSVQQGQLGFDSNQARDAIHERIKTADVIMTHSSDGDYGHLHHRFVHRCVEILCHDHVITFAAPGQGTHEFELEEIDYDRQSLPIHYDMIKSFHPDQHRNCYVIKKPTFHRITNA